MSGDPSTLVSGATRVAPPRLKSAARRVSEFLLDHQYIIRDFFPYQLWKVIVGSGMGMNCSGDLSGA
eukprot:2450036-Pyramimonas_sp.AAC.1